MTTRIRFTFAHILFGISGTWRAALQSGALTLKAARMHIDHGLQVSSLEGIRTFR